jgi:hypothetical protein
MARSVSQAPWDPRTLRRDVDGDRGDLVGYDVEATDGHMSKIDEARTTSAPATSEWTPGRGSSVARWCCFPRGRSAGMFVT